MDGTLLLHCGKDLFFFNVIEQLIIIICLNKNKLCSSKGYAFFSTSSLKCSSVVRSYG